MKRLRDLLKKSKYAVVLTGAGISTLSGIKDFRGKDGLYKNLDADKIFDIDYFYRDPSFYYSQSRNFIYNLDEREPNIIHKVLARLENEGVIKAVVTQNIDLLHQKAGSKNVIEVHGSPSVHSCLKCGNKYNFDEIAKIVNKGEVPKCDRCSGTVKPEITFFGELLPEGALEKASEEFSRADFALVLGSSLVVHPAASIPLYAIQNRAKLVIVNDMATPLDEYAELIYTDLTTVFEFLDKNMQG